MTTIYQAYPQTIRTIQDKLEKITANFGSLSVTGANTRLHNPERVSAYEEMIKLGNILTTIKPTHIPDQNTYMRLVTK